MIVGTFRVRRVLPLVALAAVAVVWVPLRGQAQQVTGGCAEAIAQAGTGQGTFGNYKLVHAPMAGGSGSQVVVGTAGGDRLSGGSGDDVLCGLGGDDVLDGGSGNDVLDGGAGNDVLQGGSGNDQLEGAAGFDRLFGGSGDDILGNGEVSEGGSGRNQIVPPSPALPDDISSAMPRTMRDEITGDFLGRGYSQRMRAENSSLNIYDAPAFNGTLLHSTAMDLSVPGGGVDCDFGASCTAYPWAQFSQPSTQSCNGCFGNIWNVFHLDTIYLAQNNNFIFMAGTKGNAFSPSTGETQYENLLYVLPSDGSCASQSCALQTISLPNQFDNCADCQGALYRAIQVTSLAAGYISGVPYVAVGLSDGGVQIYGSAGIDEFLLTDTFGGMATPDGSQTPPTALAWDPSGSGLLAIGVISWADEGFFVQINGSGKVQPNWLAWNQHGTSALGTVPFAAAFGQRPDGTPVVLFGMNNGVQLVDPKAGGAETGSLAQWGGPATIAINPIPRFDGTSGGPDFAVSHQTVPSPTFGGMGELLRWDGIAVDLTALPIVAGSTPNLATTWDDFRRWYPGIKEGRLQVSNTSGEPIAVTLQAAPDSSSGCWYAPSWADAPAFSTGPVTVEAGQISSIYTMGAYSAGPDGSCAVPPNSGEDDLWRGYLVITPTNHPADTRLVRLQLSGGDLTVDVDEQTGGATTVSIAQATPHLAAFGLWIVTVDTPAAPIPLTPPTVAASQLTPDGAQYPAVYRFDVSGAAYQLPGPYADQIVIPPLLVQGSVDGTTWADAGRLVPAVAPAIVPPTGTPAQLQLGPATFWWENASGQPAYQQIRVGFGPSGPFSPAVDLAGVAPPAAMSNVTGVQRGPTSATLKPVDTGIDQAQVSIQVLDLNSNPLPITDPSYQLIYYRTEGSHALVTNLFPASGGGADLSNFIGVSPYPGAYPNNGSAAGSGDQSTTFNGFHYFATTSDLQQNLTPFLAIDTAQQQAAASPVVVEATEIDPATTPGEQAAGGLVLYGCADFSSGACPLAPVTTTTNPITQVQQLNPAMHLDTTDGLEIGLLTNLQATTAVSSLPLQHAPGTTPSLLHLSDLQVSGTAATFTGTVLFTSGDNVDTYLVTHGTFVSITNVSY